jgi:hypothetical protein
MISEFGKGEGTDLTMKSTFLNAFGSIATVALIAIATHWLFKAKGAQLPRAADDGTSVYGIKWQFRALGLAAVVFSLVVSVWAWHDLHRPDRVMIAISATFVAIGLWLASGSVITSETGITKKVLWHRQSFRWSDITALRLHTKQGGAIELRAGSRKLVIDSRFDAFQHLRGDIENKTQLHSIEAS